MKRLFTERRGGTKPRVVGELNSTQRYTVLGLVQTHIEQGWFGETFPYFCEDGRGNAGCDLQKLKTTMAAYGVIWPGKPTSGVMSLDPADPPTDGQVFDLIEFSYEHMALPTAHDFHSYWSHSHYSYDHAAGRAKFQEEVNRIFERNGIAFNLDDSGEVTRIAPAVLQETLAETTFKTGDTILDDILDVARHKFLNRSQDVRRESLEKLWDAWERLKTMEQGKDKKARTTALLDRAATEPNLRQRLDEEAVALTQIGNQFMIRHMETDKIPISDSAHVDYLFQRMFALVRLLLKASGRGG
jgi:hypothetical protein